MSCKGMSLHVFKCISRDFYFVLYNNALLSADRQIYVKLEDVKD